MCLTDAIWNVPTMNRFAEAPNACLVTGARNNGSPLIAGKLPGLFVGCLEETPTGGGGVGLPPLKPVFPAIAARSSRVQ